jgi:hypothetical protein
LCGVDRVKRQLIGEAHLFKQFCVALLATGFAVSASTTVRADLAPLRAD